MARKLTRLSENPKMSIAQNAGKIDSGSDIAAMMVARKSREEQEDDDHCEDRALEQRRDRGLVIALGEIHRGYRSA